MNHSVASDFMQVYSFCNPFVTQDSKMPKLVEKSLTELVVRKAKATKQRYDIFDGAFRGLGLRVATSGTKSWFIMKRVNGKMTRATIGRFPEMSLTDAREAALPASKKMLEGKALEKKDTDLFSYVVADWLERDQKKNKTYKQVENAINKYALPKFGGMRVQQVKKSDVFKIIDKIHNTSPVSANRNLAYLKRFFNWCLERDLIEVNPAITIKSLSKEMSRDRVLQLDELKALWTASKSISYPFGPLLRLLILTGQRFREVSEASWNEFSLKDSKWYLPATRTKNGRAHVVHLSKATKKVLKTIPKFDEQKLIFSTNGRTPVSGISKFKKRLDNASQVSEWRFHDLRRSFATISCDTLNIEPKVIDALLNHLTGVTTGVAAVYQRAEYTEQRKEALEKWGAFVESL